MSAGNYDITIDQGSDFKLTLVIKDGDNPRNLTGYLARAHLRASYDVSVYYSFDFSDTTFDANGTIIMKMKHDVKRSDSTDDASIFLFEGNYVYDVEVYKPDGDDADTAPDEVERILQGKAKVHREVSR